MIFTIDSEACVACLACVRVCPTEAVAVDGAQVQIVDEACIACGLCLPACPHQAIHASGEIGRALTVAARGDGILILSPEATAHFYPATPEQVVNACYAAGFRTVHRGVIGDELVAAEYLSLWRDKGWGTLIRSTDPVVVETVRIDYPELVPYLAPVTIPAVAEARYLRAQHGQDLRIVYAGVAAPRNTPELDAAVTFEDLERIFELRGVAVLAQPDFFARVPEERRRHLSAAGGLPLAMLEEARYASRRFRTMRGLRHLPALAHAVAVDRLDLGFVDLLSFEGSLDHPLLGPRDQLYWRRALLASAEAPRSAVPVVDPTLVASVGATFDIRPRRLASDPTAVAALLDAIGPGPNGRPWDCGACGFTTCARFASAAVLGRATLRQCPPYQERRAEEASKEAAVDRAHRARHLPGAAGPAGPRNRAQQAQRGRLRGDVHRPGPVQAPERPVRARGGQRGAEGGGRRNPERGPRLRPGGPLRRRRVRRDPDPDRSARRAAGGRGAAGRASRASGAGWGTRSGS